MGGGSYPCLSKGKGIILGVDQLSHGMAGEDGDWKVFTKKPKNRTAGGNANQSSTRNTIQKPSKPGYIRTGRACRTQTAKTQTAVARPLQHPWQRGARPGSAPVNVGRRDGSGSDTGDQQHQSDDDDDLMSDDFDSDGSVKSHETRKKHKWFKSFFEDMDKLSVSELNEPSRKRHCPACRNGPGAIDWYKGLQPLMAHAKTKGGKRVKLHREFAQLLDEELHQRGTSVIPVGEAFGKWEGLRDTVSDRKIVWPPMIVVMNTQLELDENDQKWLGMGNPELLDYFSDYKAVKARHSYGPEGHRGMSLLIFESSAMGYLEAERLHKHFADQGTDRYAWKNNRVLFYPGGKRQLYGYIARNDDLDNFNRHCSGKMKLKFEMQSYQEMVVVPMRQMSEDNQQLVWLKGKVVKEQKHSKALEESFEVMTKKLRKTMEENRIVRQRTKMQHEENKEMMDYQEEFFKNQINIIHQALEDKERAFEEQLQEERKKVKQSNADSVTQKDYKLRREEIVAEFIQSQAKGIEEFEVERDKLIKMHEDKIADIKRKHMEEEIELEKEFETSLTSLMEQYAPHSSELLS